MLLTFAALCCLWRPLAKNATRAASRLWWMRHRPPAMAAVTVLSLKLPLLLIKSASPVSTTNFSLNLVEMTVEFCTAFSTISVSMHKLGLFNIDGVTCRPKEEHPTGAFARMREISKGKDTTIGHWEIAGINSTKPLPTYPNGFPDDVIHEFEQKTGRKVICNKPYSGTDVIMDYGKEHAETGALIVYTSADSVFQIAANEAIVPIDELYRYCQIARDLLVGKHGVGRVIARPFVGTYPDFTRTTNRHDFSLLPPKITMLDQLSENKYDVIAVGKINDIFAGKGVGKFMRTKGNAEGIDRTIEFTKKDFNGLCFINLVDFDMLYGHRNDVDGYAKALTYFDQKVPDIIDGLRDDDLLMITADHENRR